MGLYNSTYVGVFLEIPIKQVKIPETIFVNSKGKEFYDNTKFDPETGERLKEKTVFKIVLDRPQPDVEFDYDFDKFWAPTYHENCNNVKYFLINDERLINDELTTQEFSGKMDFDEEIKKFKTTYAEYLEYYRDAGYDYKIKWGVVNYAH